MLIAKLTPAPAQAQRPQIVRDVRVALNEKDLPRAEKAVAGYRAEKGADSAYLEALSWLGRGHLANKNYAAAGKYAADTRAQAVELLKQRKLDADTSLPLALGASIEVTGQAWNAQGRRSEALVFLREELEKYRSTTIRTRIQKNIHLINLEGRRSPALDVTDHVGPLKAAPLSKLRGRPVLLFFWAHWCGDCKAQAPVLARIAAEFGPRGLVVAGPTQRYGYVAEGEEAGPEKEKVYIGEIYAKYYASIPNMAAPINEENFRLWGASTTPTLVLIDRAGIVRLYNPGKLTYEDLKARIEKLLAP
jgi:thiol-disulfide isomerase/thioredoxin